MKKISCSELLKAINVKFKTSFLNFIRLATSVLAMFAVAIFISYGLHCYVPVEVVWRGYLLPRLQQSGAPPSRLRVAEYGLRIALCLITCKFFKGFCSSYNYFSTITINVSIHEFQCLFCFIFRLRLLGCKKITH